MPEGPGELVPNKDPDDFGGLGAMLSATQLLTC